MTRPWGLVPMAGTPRRSAPQRAGRDLGDDIRAAPTRLLQDVERPHEVEVRRPSRPDLVRGGDVEVTTRYGLGHFSRSGYFLRLLELLVVAGRCGCGGRAGHTRLRSSSF